MKVKSILLLSGCLVAVIIASSIHKSTPINSPDVGTKASQASKTNSGSTGFQETDAKTRTLNAFTAASALPEYLAKKKCEEIIKGLAEASAEDLIELIHSEIARKPSPLGISEGLYSLLAKKFPREAFNAACHGDARDKSYLKNIAKIWALGLREGQFQEVFKLIAQPSTPETDRALATFATIYVQSAPEEFLKQFDGLRLTAVTERIAAENMLYLSRHDPSEAAVLTKRISDPAIARRAAKEFGIGVNAKYMATHDATWLEGLNYLPDNELRWSAFAGAYGQLLKDQLDFAVSEMHKITDPNVYDTIVKTHIDLLQKKLSRPDYTKVIDRLSVPADRESLYPPDYPTARQASGS